MSSWDRLYTDLHLATMRAGGVPYGAIRDAAIAVADGRIAWLGAAADIPDDATAERISLRQRWVTPALIDCHTHLVFAGNRAQEFEQRRLGKSYAEIAAAGGGIWSTVRATRDADAASLARDARRRLRTLRAEGVATVEIKSGYGLDLDAELKMLRVAREAAASEAMCIRATFLGAHTLPREYAGRPDDYIEFLIAEVLPAANDLGLVDAVDAYCEHLAFSAKQLEPLFECARELGLPIKLHADQLSASGGAELAASYRALSADHLEFTSAEGVRALAEAGTVAVLLPGAFLTLNETQRPPVDLLREHGVNIAVATDLNPGTSPVCSLRASMTLASALFGLTAEETLAAVTREAARALGLSEDRGTLAVGKRADLAVWDIEHPAELTYWLGGNPLHGLLADGQSVTGDDQVA